MSIASVGVSAVSAIFLGAVKVTETAVSAGLAVLPKMLALLGQQLHVSDTITNDRQYGIKQCYSFNPKSVLPVTFRSPIYSSMNRRK